MTRDNPARSPGRHPRSLAAAAAAAAADRGSRRLGPESLRPQPPGAGPGPARLRASLSAGTPIKFGAGAVDSYPGLGNLRLSLRRAAAAAGPGAAAAVVAATVLGP